MKTKIVLAAMLMTGIVIGTVYSEGPLNMVLPNTEGNQDYSRRNIAQDSFMKLDRNHDGMIISREWRGSRQEFDRLDDNGDGIITRTEYFGRQEGGRNTGMFRAFDLNDNGVISRQEWVRNFEALDRNHDGKIERNEIYFQGSNNRSATQKLFQELFRNN